MKKTLFRTLSALLAATALSTAAIAAPITGAITFKGGVTLDTGSAGTATAVTGWSGVTVHSSDGDFTGLNGSAVTLTAPWSFTSGALANLWSVGGFTFDLISSAINFQGAGSVSVGGNGTLKAAGYTDTAGIWSFTTQDPSAGTPAEFSFSAASGVPEGGTTALMVGLALVGMSILGFRRRMA